MSKRLFSQQVCALALAALACGAAQALDWSDNALSWRAGTDYREPFNPDAISKNIFAFSHASGYQYGTNYFNLDVLLSDKHDPRSLGSDAGAQEAYAVYRHTLDLGKLRGSEIRFGAVRGVGLVLGFDWNFKRDVAYNSRKRMLVAGPTLMWDVPGFLNTGVLMIHESNAPGGAFPPIANVNGRYTYDLHPMFSAAWGIVLSPSWSFDGFANVIAAKGIDEVGNPTGPETDIDMQLMWDASPKLGYKKNTLRVGFEYQYWNNKFGNTERTTGARGYRAKTPMLRAEYHF